MKKCLSFCAVVPTIVGRILAIAIVCVFLCASSARVLAGPSLGVTANHLGDGLVQYTLTVMNDLADPRNVTIQITARGEIHQVQSSFFPDAPPDGGVDLLSEADVATIHDPTYISNGGAVADSWWDDTLLTTTNPPFGWIVPDAAAGGYAGSTQFSFSRGTLLPSPVSVVSERIGQIVIDDVAAATLPIGPVTVSTNAGFALMEITDGDPVLNPSGQLVDLTDTIIAYAPNHGGSIFIDQSYFVQAFDAGAGEDTPLLGFSAAPGIVEYEDLGMANSVTPVGAANEGVWVDAELLPGDKSLLIQVTEGSLLEIGLPTLAGFADANGNYTVAATDNPFEDTVAPGDFVSFADPISGADTVIIGDIVNGQSSIPIFLATSGTSVTITSVPEPTGIVMALLAIFGLSAGARPRRRES